MQEIIIDFLFGSREVSQGLAPLAIAAIGQGVSSLIGAFSAGRQKRQARNASAQYQRDLARLEANRQEIINPYAGAQDLSSMVTNPYENLQVATKAAEMQARETDISLASTLDALRATGGGSATALAQSASRAKQGVAASIEQQEAKNAQLRAYGEAQMQQLRLQEGARVQGLEAAGQQFMFDTRETREMQQLNRTAGLLDQSRAMEAQARSAQNQAIGSLIGTAASFGAQALGGTNPFSGNPMKGSFAEYQAQGGTMDRQGFRGIKGFIN